MRRVATVLMVVVLVQVLSAAAGAVSRWRVTPLVIPRALNGQLSGQSCVSALACMAVGSTATAGGLVEPLAEQWSGRGWMVERPPMPAGARLGQLFSVSCSSTQVCSAFGRFATASGVSRSLVERFSGAGWRVVAAVDPAGSPWSALSSVSCTSAAACLAVGDTQTAAGPHVAYSERWNGRAWHLLATPNLPGAQSAFLDGLACLTSTSCIAVGGSDASGLAERWDGTRWHLLAAVPSPAGAVRLPVRCRLPVGGVVYRRWRIGSGQRGRAVERLGVVPRIGAQPDRLPVLVPRRRLLSHDDSMRCGGRLHGCRRSLHHPGRPTNHARMEPPHHSQPSPYQRQHPGGRPCPGERCRPSSAESPAPHRQPARPSARRTIPPASSTQSPSAGTACVGTSRPPPIPRVCPPPASVASSASARPTASPSEAQTPGTSPSDGTAPPGGSSPSPHRPAARAFPT